MHQLRVVALQLLWHWQLARLMPCPLAAQLARSSAHTSPPELLVPPPSVMHMQRPLLSVLSCPRAVLQICVICGLHPCTPELEPGGVTLRSQAQVCIFFVWPAGHV